MLAAPKLALLDGLDQPTRKIVLAALDELTRPLDRREVEKALGRSGYTRREREEIIPAMMRFDLIAVVPRDD